MCNILLHPVGMFDIFLLYDNIKPGISLDSKFAPLIVRKGGLSSSRETLQRGDGRHGDVHQNRRMQTGYKGSTPVINWAFPQCFRLSFHSLAFGGLRIFGAFLLCWCKLRRKLRGLNIFLLSIKEFCSVAILDLGSRNPFWHRLNHLRLFST